MQDQNDRSAGTTGSHTGDTSEDRIGGKQGQHRRGEEMPVEKRDTIGRRTGTESQSTGPDPDRPDEC